MIILTYSFSNSSFIIGSILARRYIFNDSAPGRFSLVVVMGVCPIARNFLLCLNGLDWKLLVKEHIDNIGRFDDFFVLKSFSFVFWALQSSLLYSGWVSRGGSMAVAVSVSDRWHVTSKKWQVTCDISFFIQYWWY